MVQACLERRVLTSWIGAFESTAKGRLDLTIEVWDDEADVVIPRIVVLDATRSLRLDNQTTKFLYHEAIQDFACLEGSCGRAVRNP